MQGGHSCANCGAQLPGQVAHKPEDLLAEVFLLLWSYSGRGEAILLHGLLDPDAQEAEAVLVQGKEDFCKVIHEAAGSLATDALPQSKEHAEPTLSLSLLPPMLLGSLALVPQGCCSGTEPSAAWGARGQVPHLQHCLQQRFAVLMHDLSHWGDLSTARQQLRLQHRGQAHSVPAQAPHCSTRAQPQPHSCLPSSQERTPP